MSFRLCRILFSNAFIVSQVSGPFEDLDDDTYQKSVKAAQTSFSLIKYDEESDTSVVLCRPETVGAIYPFHPTCFSFPDSIHASFRQGRTHQLRLHLQHLGHPIANDPNYGGDIFFGNPEGRKVCRQAQLALDQATQERNGRGECSKPSGETPARVTSDEPATPKEVEDVSQAKRGDHEALDDFILRTCVWCNRENDPTLEFLVRSPGLWLHALQYTISIDGTASSFRTAVPDWCLP